ncbi:Rieske (2Fe-2S) region [Rubrobacter xylanophilus DSM 9941]|uniref:Rieske (2Fe-2S) region n=1 Tax=Rubrobacter xylanophilus (strain DSM 9941 / JCM 11954 / NBRC 16129 / PRD-1) TaxID=266117 RepID=Q1AS46_RUBXD|nr:Rieske (2Fe-2S) protein [Rubrobacter xylanophilus]ABG05782.1 Rieske (2Fe-2S) region [Rubrobacter xylanophilus DSM 9941]
MAKTIGERIVEAMPYLDEVSEAVQPRVREAVEAGGTAVRNLLDGTWMEVPLHPVLTDVPVGSWTSALVFDGLDALSGSRAARNAADASLAFGVLGGLAAAAAGLSDWRYLTGDSRRMGAAHGLFNAAGLALAAASLGLRAAGRRNAGRAVFLAGYALAGVGAHLGGELSYGHGLRVNRNALRGQEGPREFVPVLRESELPAGGMRRVSADGAEVLLARSSGGEICAISAVCGHLGGALEEGRREGDTVVCPLHGSRFELCGGKVLDGPAVFPQPRYEVRVREGSIEVRSAGI